MNARSTIASARASLERHDYHAAIGAVWRVADLPHTTDGDFASLVQIMGQAAVGLQRPRAASAALRFLGQLDAAWRVSEDPRDRARVRDSQGDLLGASKLYEAAGWLGHAALRLEQAGDYRPARILWERLSKSRGVGESSYLRGLVHFNLSSACAHLDDPGEARRHSVIAMHSLEAAADGFTQAGLRERAFDCYQVLIHMGRNGAFENLAEGYLGSIRVLREDGFKYFVLQYYEDFQKLAVERGEFHAASTLFREAAEFCKVHHLPFAAHYLAQAASAQTQRGQQLAARGAAEMAENAYAASIDILNDLGWYAKVREVYGLMARLELPEARIARYQRLGERLTGHGDQAQTLTTFPDYLRTRAAYPEIWRLDVIEWEQNADPADTVAELVGDPAQPSFVQRRALLCQLAQFLGDGSPATYANLSERLGDIGSYTVLSPLENLIDHESKLVRRSVLSAARKLLFKRTFNLIRKGLVDQEDEVREVAAEAVSRLHFNHAFDPLQRIFYESREADARLAALGSVGQIASLEAAEFLVEVLRTGSRAERQMAFEQLRQSARGDAAEVIRRAASYESNAEVKQALQSLVN